MGVGKKVVVSGVGMTRFGELWDEDVLTLSKKAVDEALADAEMGMEEIDVLVVGNMLLSTLYNQAHVGAYVAGGVLYGGPALAVEGACASGGLAVRQAYMMIKSGMVKNALVVGVEKMTDASGDEITQALAGAAGMEEQFVGATFPSLYGLMHGKYLDDYKIDGDDLATVSEKNHFNGSKNSKAHFQNQIGVDDVNSSDMVADPVRLLHCSPISDGAAAVVLSDKSKLASGDVEVVGSAQAGDTILLADRKSITSLAATKKAFSILKNQAGFALEEIDLMEVHDCFSIAEIMAIEDMGYCKAGKGVDLYKSGFGRLDSDGVVINSSGGLKACGHPVGATGVKQIIEIVEQFRGNAGDRQVPDVNMGVTHNVGGTGATVVMHALRRKS